MAVEGTRFIRHLRSNAVAYLALFFALGIGTAWAIEVNSVKSKHIQDGQVRSKDVRDNDLKGIDVNEGTLGGVDAATVGGTKSCTGSTLVEGDDEVICEVGELKVTGSCGGNLAGAVSFDTGTENDVSLGAEGDTIITEPDVDASDPAINLVTETDTIMGNEGETSPPATFYADGASGVMAGTVGLLAKNDGPGSSFCKVTSAISAKPAG